MGDAPSPSVYAVPSGAAGAPAPSTATADRGAKARRKLRTLFAQYDAALDRAHSVGALKPLKDAEAALGRWLADNHDIALRGEFND